LGDGVKRIENNEEDTAMVQRRALRLAGDLQKGHVLSKKDLVPLRPIPPDGIPPYELNKIIGKKLVKDVAADEYIRLEDAE
jgi:N-acetylneuraminate synthase